MKLMIVSNFDALKSLDEQLVNLKAFIKSAKDLL